MREQQTLRFLMSETERKSLKHYVHFLMKKPMYRRKSLRIPEEKLNADYQEKLITKVACRYIAKAVIPFPVRAIYTTFKSLKYIYAGVRSLCTGKLEVAVLDATAIGVSVLRDDIATASSVMFLLGIGELLEEWTHKKSVDDLARSLSLNVKRILVEER